MLKTVPAFFGKAYCQDDSLNESLEFNLNGLTSRSTLCFRIRIVNSVGRSYPSRVVELHLKT